MFAHSVPGLPERAAAEGLTPLEWMRRYGAFEISRGQGARARAGGPGRRTCRRQRRARSGGCTRAAPAGGGPEHRAGRRAGARRRRAAAPAGVDGGRRRPARVPDPVRAAGVLVLDAGRVGLARARAARLHPQPRPPVAARPRTRWCCCRRSGCRPRSTPGRPTPNGWTSSRTPTRCGSTRADAARFGIGRTGDLVRVETEIGYFVAKAWITEGIRPGVVACSHHMGRWRLDGGPRGAGGMMATVGLDRGGRLGDERRAPAGPYESADPDSQRIWWSDTGVHQNLTFAVQPDPISGMHCWHQAVRVRPAGPGDRPRRHRGGHRQGARRSTSGGCRRPARPGQVSPDGTRRPRWLMRPLKPAAAGVRAPGGGPGGA